MLFRQPDYWRSATHVDLHDIVIACTITHATRLRRRQNEGIRFLVQIPWSSIANFIHILVCAVTFFTLTCGSRMANTIYVLAIAKNLLKETRQLNACIYLYLSCSKEWPLYHERKLTPRPGTDMTNYWVMHSSLVTMIWEVVVMICWRFMLGFYFKIPRGSNFGKS